MSYLKLKNFEGQELFERFKISPRWETIDVFGYKNFVYCAVFRDINNGKFVFVTVGKSNSGKTEYWSFDEQPNGSYLLKIFQRSLEWEEISSSHHSARNDYDSRNNSNWIFRNKNGKHVTIRQSSANRNGNSSNWGFDGNKKDIPDFRCLIKQ